jgi:hypothetical protein
MIKSIINPLEYATDIIIVLQSYRTDSISLRMTMASMWYLNHSMDSKNSSDMGPSSCKGNQSKSYCSYQQNHSSLQLVDVFRKWFLNIVVFGA